MIRPCPSCGKPAYTQFQLWRHAFMGSVLTCPHCSSIAYMSRGWFAELLLFIFVELAFLILLVAAMVLWGNLLLGLAIFFASACFFAWRRTQAPLYVHHDTFDR